MKRSYTLNIPALANLGKRVILPVLIVTAFQNTAFAVQFTKLFDFNGSGASNSNGAHPWAGLVRDSAGNLYGTTYWGGDYGGYGTVFKLAPPAAGQTTWTETMLVNFNYTSGIGSNPRAGLVRDSAGNLYGTTWQGGSYGAGTVFKLTPPAAGQTAWTETILVNFDSTHGAYPWAGLVRDSAGNLYGTTNGGGAYGYGTVFKVAPPAAGQTAWTRTTLVNFNNMNGAYPTAAGLVRDSAGNLYGTTNRGGAYGYGTVFKVAPPAAGQTAWTRTTLVNFNGTNGKWPAAGLVRDSAGNLYGTTYYGGAYNYGTVFKLTPPAAGQTAWTRTTLVNFNATNGAYPAADLVLDSTGHLYGTTTAGGAYSYGTVFKLTPPAAGQTSWKRATLVTFNGANGASPRANLVLDSAGNLYGTAYMGGSYDEGTAFKITP